MHKAQHKAQSTEHKSAAEHITEHNTAHSRAESIHCRTQLAGRTVSRSPQATLHISDGTISTALSLDRVRGPFMFFPGQGLGLGFSLCLAGLRPLPPAPVLVGPAD